METWREVTVSERRQYDLIALIFSNHPKLLEFFFEKNQARLSLPPEAMLKELGCFSSGEQVLLRVALDMWSGSGNAFVWQLIETLDHDTFYKVLKALNN